MRNRDKKAPHLRVQGEQAPIEIKTEAGTGQVPLPFEQGHPVRTFRPVGPEKDGEPGGREPKRGMMRRGELPGPDVVPELEPVIDRVEQAMPGPDVPAGVVPGAVIHEVGLGERIESGHGKMFDQKRTHPVDDPAVAVPVLEGRLRHEIAGWLGSGGGTPGP